MPAISEVSISNRRQVPLDTNGHPIDPDNVALDAIGAEAGVVGTVGVITKINWAWKSRLRRIVVQRTSGVGTFTVRVLSASTLSVIATIYEAGAVSGLLDEVLDLVCVNQAGEAYVYLQILADTNGDFDWRLTGNVMV